MRIITGMHRSGTSLVANLVFQAGGDLGSEDTFYRPDRWNSKGYFEQPDIHAINMPLVHGPWGRLAYFSLPSHDTILKRGQKSQKAIRVAAEKYQNCVVKDARFCITLPAWLDQQAPIQTVLACLRHPLAVAQSINRRNRMPLSVGFSLWKEHNQRLLRTAADSLWLLNYEKLCNRKSFNQELTGAFTYFGIRYDSEMIEELHNQTFDPNMNHAQFETSVKLPADVEDCWNELLHLHEKQSTNQTATEAA